MPGEAEEAAAPQPPVYVNAKQYHRIMVRREERARLDLEARTRRVSEHANEGAGAREGTGVMCA